MKQSICRVRPVPKGGATLGKFVSGRCVGSPPFVWLLVGHWAVKANVSWYKREFSTGMDYLSAFLKRLLFVGGGDEVFLPYSLYIFSDKLISCFIKTLINKWGGNFKKLLYLCSRNCQIFVFITRWNDFYLSKILIMVIVFRFWNATLLYKEKMV